MQHHIKLLTAQDRVFPNMIYPILLMTFLGAALAPDPAQVEPPSIENPGCTCYAYYNPDEVSATIEKALFYREHHRLVTVYNESTTGSDGFPRIFSNVTPECPTTTQRHRLI